MESVDTKREMQVMLIDPWGVRNTSEYLNGLISGLDKLTKLTVYTNYYFSPLGKPEAEIHKIFFRKSERMEKRLGRTLLRGVEYLFAYARILREAKGKEYDVVHVNWLLWYRWDILFLRLLKTRCGKIVYTAHNVLPHVHGEKAIPQLRKIYSLADTIIVHGTSLKEELVRRFPEAEGKVYVQRHGCIIHEPQPIQPSQLPPTLRELVSSQKRVCLFCGAIYPEKGVDRLARIWLENFSDRDAFLLIAGRQAGAYPEFDKLKNRLRNGKNTFLMEGFVDEGVMEYLFSACHAVILPYRHASMSGIVFSAAQHAKPILCTDVGALTEYLEPGSDSFVCENDEEHLREGLAKLLGASSSELEMMGRRLKEHILEKCGWDGICKGVVQHAYGAKGDHYGID